MAILEPITQKLNLGYFKVKIELTYFLELYCKKISYVIKG